MQQRAVLVVGALGRGKPCLEPCLELPRALQASRPKKGRPTRGAHKMIYGFDFDFDQSRHPTPPNIFCVSLFVNNSLLAFSIINLLISTNGHFV